MTTKSFATELRDVIRSIRDEQGVSEIKSDNLIAYLEEIINSPEEEITLHKWRNTKQSFKFG